MKLQRMKGGNGLAGDLMMPLRSMPPATKAASSEPTSSDSHEAKITRKIFAPAKFPKSVSKLYFPTARNSVETQTGAKPETSRHFRNHDAADHIETFYAH